MANWLFTTPTTDEAPFAWNVLHERFRIARGITIKEVSPGVYEAERYAPYTDEIGAVNLPPNPNADNTAFWPAPATGLHVFRGGYEWIVDDAVKADLIASGLVTNANFTPAP